MQRDEDEDGGEAMSTLPEDEPILPDEAPSWRGGASFCPECGTENLASAESCYSCGRSLDLDADELRADDPRRKLHGVVVATVAGISMVCVVLAWLTGLSLRIGVTEVMHVQGDHVEMIEILASEAGLGQVFGLAFAFGLAGLVAALVFGGRYLREVVLGAVAGIFVQFILWLLMIRAAGGTMRLDLWIAGEGFVMRGPAPILLPQLLLLFLFTAMAMAFGGWIAREQITGRATCIHCHTAYALRPRPPVRCPKCDAVQERDGVQWPWVLLVAVVTAGLFAVLTHGFHDQLGFALECQAKLSEACEGARRDDGFTIFVTELGDDGFVFWAINQGKMIAIGAILMFVAPLVLTFVVKRSSRASAGALIPINWLLATFVVMSALSDLGKIEAGFIFIMRMQVMALFAWGGVGVVAVMIGDKLRYRHGSAYLDELDD